MKKARTILAIMLALVMVLSVLPASFAEESKKLDRKGDASLADRNEAIQSKTERTFKPLSTRFEGSKAIDPEAIVTAIVIFDDPALSDTYTAEEIREKKAESVQNRMSNAHDTFFKSLSFEAERMYDYTALINGMSLRTAYKNLLAMEQMDGVKNVYVANEYNAPDYEKPEQMNANLITGAAAMQDIRYKGEGMVVAVLDTGLNLNHEAFQDYGLLRTPAFTEEYVSSIETIVDGKYISKKIPFTYDYYDMDDDVTDYNGHGSHVSGTIAGFVLDTDGAVTFSGAAPYAQLVFMKIFADQSSGTNSGIYMAALEDCYRLGVDAINMSIGSPGGFVYDPELEENVFGNVYDKLDKAGVIVCISAGNEYSMAHNAGNIAGDGFVLPEYADYAEVASPSTYEGNISVASMENFAYPSLAIEYNGEAFPYVDNCSDGEHGWLDTFGNKTVELVYCGTGNPDEIPDSVAGKVALVVRGDISFSEKNANVAEKGAIGMILFNNQAGSIGMMIDPYYVPAISIQQEAGLKIQEGLDVDNIVSVPTDESLVANPNAWLMSTFSSWGCTPNLELKPTISAPGGMIYSAVAGASDAYEVYSGTSMASPNACGSFLLLAEYLKDTYPDLDKVERAALAEDLMESTASLPVNADGYLYSPRKSGSGILNIYDAITSPVYLEEPIVNLYDDPDKTGVYEIPYTLVNLTDSEQVYTADLIDLFDFVVTMYNSTGKPVGDYNTLTSDYLFDGEGLTVAGDLEATVPANGTFDGVITITLDDTTKAKFDEKFKNGTYIEGYIAFNAAETNVAMTVPVCEGIYGDVNLDSVVNAADAVMILRSVVGLIELSEEEAFFADLNQSGTVTAADAAYLLRALIGFEVLPTIVSHEEVAPSTVHLTYMGFYGDWTQGPVLDKVWTNSVLYLNALALENVYYPQYAQAGYMPENIGLVEPNITVSNVYGLDANMEHLYNYIGRNPATVLLSDEELVADAWAEYLTNEQYRNRLHNAISNETSDCDMYFVEMMYSLPIQLRNARNLKMTVTDYFTDEIYLVDDSEYLGKAYFNNDNGVWQSRGSFYWDGINYNEDSDNFGEFVPNGTICQVKYETKLDYPTAELNEEYSFYMIVDTASPVVTGVEVTEEEIAAQSSAEGEDPAEPTIKKTVTISLADNGSGLSFADAYYYDNALDGGQLAAEVGNNAAKLVLDITDLPEDVTFVFVEALDYATNLTTYTVNIKTGEVLHIAGDYASAEYLVNLMNTGAAEDIVVPMQGIVTDIYNGTIYASTVEPVKGTPMGMAVKLSDEAALAEIHVGDTYVFAGKVADDNGCPTLTDAEITFVLYINEDYEEDVGDAVWGNVIYPVVLYPWFGLAEEITFEDLFTDSYKYVGTIVYFEELDVANVTENDDGTRTITLTDGENSLDIVGCKAGANSAADDALSYGYFVPILENGALKLRPVQDGVNGWVTFLSDEA